MAKKKILTKTELATQIELKIQDLNLLLSALKGDRSRKPEILEDYHKKYQELLSEK